jgi:hypothetical protein
MGNGAFSTGLRLVRLHRAEFLDPARLRRRTIVSCGVAGAAGVVLVVLDLVWGVIEGPWPLHVVALTCFAAAVGCLVAAFLPVAAPDATPSLTAPTGDWKRDERIARQFSARPPAMLPEDRDLVLARADRSLGPSVVAAARFVWLPVAWVVAGIGVLASGVAASGEVVPLLLPPVLALLQSATFIAVVTATGRAEEARHRALALPSTPVVDPAPRRNADPRGSKVGLPGD